MPSFEELFPGLRGENGCDGTNRKKHIGVDYYQVGWIFNMLLQMRRYSVIFRMR